jgi:hypothetical protein
MTATENLLRKRSVTTGGQDASQGVLAALAVFVLAASMISIGIFAVVFAQIVPTISFVMQGRSQ